MYGIEQMDKLMKLSTLILEGMQTFGNQGFEFGLNSLLAGTAESVRMVDRHGFRHEFAQVFNFGGGDLLQVMIGSAENVVLQNSENTGSTPPMSPCGFHLLKILFLLLIWRVKRFGLYH